MLHNTSSSVVIASLITKLWSRFIFNPPDPFNFRDTDDWLCWKWRFQQFRIASGLAEENADKQVSTLLYCLEEEAEAFLTSTNTTADDCKDFRVLDKFDEFLQVRKDIIYKHARFNGRQQQSEETAEQYIMALYNLTDNCDYGMMKEEMICDRLIAGTCDTALSKWTPKNLSGRGRRSTNNSKL